MTDWGTSSCNQILPRSGKELPIQLKAPQFSLYTIIILFSLLCQANCNSTVTIVESGVHWAGWGATWAVSRRRGIWERGLGCHLSSGEDSTHPPTPALLCTTMHCFALYWNILHRDVRKCNVFMDSMRSTLTPATPTGFLCKCCKQLWNDGWASALMLVELIVMSVGWRS